MNVFARRPRVRYAIRMAKVLRLRTERQLFELEGLLCGDDPVRLALYDGTHVIGMALSWSDDMLTVLGVDGVRRRYPYAEILDAKPLDPGPDFDAVVCALEQGGFIMRDPPELRLVKPTHRRSPPRE